MEERSEWERGLANRRRCMAFGDALLEGPRAIFPPRDLDDLGWLDPQARITVRWPGGGRLASLIVFCDDTVNRESGFLAPFLRHAEWDRAADLRGANPWPSARVRLGTIRDLEAAHALLLDLHRQLSSLPFEPLGLSARREVVDLEMLYDLPEVSVRALNGCQAIEYTSHPLAGHRLCESVMEIFSSLLEELQPIEPAGWR